MIRLFCKKIFERSLPRRETLVSKSSIIFFFENSEIAEYPLKNRVASGYPDDAIPFTEDYPPETSIFPGGALSGIQN